jgi:hypothetical protein
LADVAASIDMPEYAGVRLIKCFKEGFIMDNIMAVSLNGIAQLEYDRNKALPPQQQLYLDKMDEKMDIGIFVGEATITNPQLNQRAQFVAGNLAHAILSDNEAMCSALTAYLALRLPDLHQVKITNHQTENAASDAAADALSIELVFDEAYQKQVEVKLLH